MALDQVKRRLAAILSISPVTGGCLDEARAIIERLRDITPSVIPGAEHWRVPQQREFFLAGLCSAAGEAT